MWLKQLHHIFRLQFTNRFQGPQCAKHRRNGPIDMLADCLVDPAHGVVQDMISDVTREIHHIEIDELGKMSIVTDRLIYQRAVDKAGCCVDYSKSPVVD